MNGKAPPTSHPLDALTQAEILRARDVVLSHVRDPVGVRFNSISLLEPPKAALNAFARGCSTPPPPREAEVVCMKLATGRARVVVVVLGGQWGDVVASEKTLPAGTQPCFTPDDCLLAERIVKQDARVAEMVLERYGIADLALLACDPWSVHVADPAGYEPLRWRGDGGKVPPRLVQAFLYRREDELDNQYAHPLDLLPVVDLLGECVVALQGVEDGAPARSMPRARVNYHRDKLADNDYLEAEFRAERLAPLEIVQPDGPGFRVRGRAVSWQKWTFRVGFNYREAMVLHDVRYDGREVLSRASLVEMTVPYAEPRAPFHAKNAGDVGDYGLGFCATSLALGCDCKGDITYLDAVLSDAAGEPYVLRNAVCLHEEDAGVLWKHAEYRVPGRVETRRARVLVLQCSITVVNYEYLLYVTFGLDGSMHFDVKLTGELSTNVLHPSEEERGAADYGTIVAPNVNAQFHQHMFCYRLDMSVDGGPNRVSEETIAPVPVSAANPYGNAFRVHSVPLTSERVARRPQPAPGTTWRVENAGGARNAANSRATAYRLVPNTRGTPQPLLLTHADSAVSRRARFATAALWVTPQRDAERFPAGEFPTQSDARAGGDGLEAWTAADRGLEAEDVVLWHSFGVAHVPRVEDFPVMPVEVVGFALKPDGFFDGNPAVDLHPETVGESKMCCVSVESAVPLCAAGGNGAAAGANGGGE